MLSPDIFTVKNIPVINNKIHKSLFRIWKTWRNINTFTRQCILLFPSRQQGRGNSGTLWQNEKRLHRLQHGTLKHWDRFGKNTLRLNHVCVCEHSSVWVRDFLFLGKSADHRAEVASSQASSGPHHLAWWQAGRPPGWGDEAVSTTR